MEKRVLMIIAPQNFRDEELLHTREELERVGAKVTIASKKVAPARGMLGAVVKPELELKQVRVDDYDVVIFVGGSGSAVYFTDEQAISIAKEVFKKGKILCAICIAPVILANAGVLNGKRATAFPDDSVQKLKNKGAIYTGKSVEVDGKIITADGPAAAREFGRRIAKELG